MSRRLALGVAGLVSLVTSGPSARADDAATPLRTTIACEAPPAPGRFRCDVEVRVASGTLSWADVVVVRTDDFILPLRGRLGPRDASTRDADIARWSLGFVAKGRGVGDVTVRVRAVVCHGEACEPVVAEVAGRVVVAR